MLSFIGKTAGKLYEKVTKRAKSSSFTSKSLKKLTFFAIDQGSAKAPCDFYLKNRQLPQNFAENLLNLELELEEGQYSLAKITQLLELYSVF